MHQTHATFGPGIHARAWPLHVNRAVPSSTRVLSCEPYNSCCYTAGLAPSLPHAVRAMPCHCHAILQVYYTEDVSLTRADVETQVAVTNQALLRARAGFQLVLLRFEKVGAWVNTGVAPYRKALIWACERHARVGKPNGTAESRA